MSDWKYLSNYKDKDAQLVQTDNPTEEMDRKRGRSLYLQTCGPTSATMLVAATGNNTLCSTPGDYHPQPEEVLTDFFNDPRNYEALTKVRKETPADEWVGNEIPQFYTYAVKEVFDVDTEFTWGNSFELIKTNIDQNKGLLGCLKDPGHYIAIIGYNEASRMIMYNDPWPEDYWPSRLKGTSNFYRTITEEEWLANAKPFFVLIG